MQAETKRIFIKELPDNCTELDVRKKFSKFGDVSSIEIKQRKDLGNRNASQNFAFVNILIDAFALQNCFKDISNVPWRGKYVEIQLAKESFLDRLKKEREESQQSEPQERRQFNEDNIKAFNEKKRKLDEDVTKDIEEVDSTYTYNGNGVNLIEEVNFDEVYAGIKVKNNKDVKLNNKIESFGFEPIIKIEPKQPKSKDPSRTEADRKRINSMMEMKKNYNQQKFAIKRALSKIDANPAPLNTEEKVIQKTTYENPTKPALFEDDGSDDETLNLNLKEQFQGKKGQELFNLQTKFNTDSRFKMDQRFVESENVEENIDNGDEAEEFKQLEILGEVLGTKSINLRSREEKVEKLMVRFDPTRPLHSKYELKLEKEKKRKNANVSNDTERKKLAKKNVEVHEAIPEVSKETFFEVTDSLKDSLKEKESFSLINMFGNNYEENTQEAESNTVLKSKPQLENGSNPFKYDSSTDEEGEDDDKHLEEITAKEDTSNSTKVNLGPTKLWTEPFFFKKDDYRLQEGFDFLKRIAGDNSTAFTEVRNEIKGIAKHKMKLFKVKENRFTKKLGGAKKRFKKKRNFNK